MTGVSTDVRGAPQSIARNAPPAPILSTGDDQITTLPERNRMPIMEARNVGASYDRGKSWVIKDISLPVFGGSVLALIGASGSGKSTFLRCLNRINDQIANYKFEGQVLLGGTNIYTPGIEATELRRRVGMVFQTANLFPQSIYFNVAWGPRTILGLSKSALDTHVEHCLKQAGLFEEVKDRLKRPALSLSGGQQQRLSIARALAMNPEVLLMDEPCSALDPIASGRIEDLIMQLKTTVPIVIVTHNMQQAMRISDTTAFFYQPQNPQRPARIEEIGDTSSIFMMPTSSITEAYIKGKFG